MSFCSFFCFCSSFAGGGREIDEKIEMIGIACKYPYVDGTRTGQGVSPLSLQSEVVTRITRVL